MNVSQTVNRRYSTKKFDPAKKIPAADWAQMQDALRGSPSSVNIQPWHFVIADDEAGKARIAKATAEHFPFNTPKVADASHVVVFAAKTHADDAFLDKILEKEDQDGRYAQPEFKKGGDDARRTFLGIHRNTIQDEAEWLSRQVHINLGFALMAAAALGIDAVPMEGVDLAALDKEFGLAEKGFRSVAIVSFGYRADDDFNAQLPKSRLAEADVFSKA
ncbi:oxygen-insensitive NAD(P)H nitroreductase [Eikenella sp. S3360]|uniref:Oxygen-insensitive NAD(P)H nitroreductase n=1 Tax=Eikenella glucosivorans TaxID=2766967 RepID=A0ABS0NC93_9NEIS|nr:oxygen-insensitive NAD(P)H nitroreductase [Eikenella glucosivorans]MBH5329932.1 oxygen-insensitive NAD(P)H nitroreductase [Eikenella glucosivorans]